MSGFQAPRGDQPQPGRYSTIVGIDPRIEWLLGPGFPYFQPYGPEGLIPFTVRLEDRNLRELLLRPLPNQRGPVVLPIDQRRGSTSEYLTLMAPRSFFDTLARRDGPLERLREAPKQIHLSLPLPPRCLPHWASGEPEPALVVPQIGPPEGGWPAESVIVAVIDDGIGFANARFRSAVDRTRIQCFWHQDGTPPTGANTVKYGREILKAEIDQLLKDNMQAGVVDEDSVYQQSGLIDFGLSEHKSLGWRLAHGTHVLDLAAGEDLAAAPNNRPIICVQLPVAATAEQSGAGLEEFVTNAFGYILERAALLAGSGSGALLPLVINFSYGIMMGPKDGRSAIEDKIDKMIAASSSSAPIRVVLPAGNSHLTRTAAKVRFSSTSPTVNLNLRVQPDDRTVSQVQVWLPRAGTTPPTLSRLSLTLTSPGGTTVSGPITETSTPNLPVTLGGVDIGKVEYAFLLSPTNRGVFTISLNPTEASPLAPDNPLAPHGLWTITLENTGLGADEEVHAWVERDDQLYGYPRLGRQSYFDEICYTRFDEASGRPLDDDPLGTSCLVQRKTLINAIATGTESFVVGGFQRSELEAAAYSAGGPILPRPGGPLTKDLRPDALLVSDDSEVHAGVLASGSRSGSVVAMAGTSVAAPQLARRVATYLATTNFSRPDLVTLAEMEEGALPASKPALPPDRGGWGRIGAADSPSDHRRRFWPDP